MYISIYSRLHSFLEIYHFRIDPNRDEHWRYRLKKKALEHPRVHTRKYYSMYVTCSRSWLPKRFSRSNDGSEFVIRHHYQIWWYVLYLISSIDRNFKTSEIDNTWLVDTSNKTKQWCIFDFKIRDYVIQWSIWLNYWSLHKMKKIRTWMLRLDGNWFGILNRILRRSTQQNRYWISQILG